MINALTEVVEGWTGALPFTLNADGEPVVLTGMTLTVILKDGKGATVLDTSSSGTVYASNSTAGEVTLTPSTGTFVATKTPYKLRFQVADALGKIVFFPNEDEDVIKVNVR